MTKKLSPEEIAEMSEDHQCSCKELEQLRADISEAYYLRDKAEGRYCTALGAIEQLHAAVKTAQELAATRLMEIRRLSKREKDLMDVIDSRDRALGFVPLDEVHASEPGVCVPFDAKLNASIEAVAKVLQEEASSDPTFPVRGLANYAGLAGRIIRAVAGSKEKS